jgi:hypothetical protein
VSALLIPYGRWALTATTAASPQCGGSTVTVTGGNVITISGAIVNYNDDFALSPATVTGVTAGSYINGPTNTSITGWHLT